MRVALIGNYGTGNVGDEALKEYFLTRFPEVQWVVLSASPEGDAAMSGGRRWIETQRLPFGLRSFVGGGWLRTLRLLRDCDALVFGGGSLFTDVESVKAPLLWWWHARVARWLGVPIFLAFQGIGPLKTRVGKWCAGRVLGWSSYVSVRDSNFVYSGKMNTKIIHTFDPVILSLMKEKNDQNAKKLLIIIPRFNSGKKLFDAVQKVLSVNKFDGVAILMMQPSEDRRAAQALLKMLPDNTSLHDAITIDSLLKKLCGVSFVVTERYHGAMAAMAAGIPVEIVSQGAGDKLDGLRKMLESGVSIEELKARVRLGEETLRSAWEEIKNRHKGMPKQQ